MKRFPIALAVAAFALVSAGSAFADGGIKIDGTVTQSITADNNTNTAQGNESFARQVFGVINADVAGSVDQNVNANNNTNLAEGEGSEACQAFGVIGPVEDVCGYEKP
jgi:hypothetical protein